MLDHSDSASSCALVDPDPSVNNDDFDVQSSFSLISDGLEDDFSLISFCGSTVGEIELAPSVKCYKHSRNAKLNKQLDFAVILSYALVAGLGIGNFIGRSDPCSPPCANKGECFVNIDPVWPRTPLEKPCDAFEKNCEVPIKAPNPVSIVDGKDGSHEFPKSSHGHYQISILVDPLADHTSLLSADLTDNITHAVFVNEGTWFQPDEISDNGVSLFPTNDLTHELELIFPHTHDLMEYPDINFKVNQKMNYSDVLNILNNDIKNIVHKMQELVTNTVKEENAHFIDVTQLNNMFNDFYVSVEHKTNELDKLFTSKKFKSPVNGKKQFLRMSHIIIKSVDKMLKNSFIKILLKGEKNLSYRLKNICNIGYDAITALEKRWSTEKRKLMYHSNKREKLNHFANDKHQNKHKKHELKNEKEHHFKHKKSFEKNDKKVFHKKRY